MPLAETFEKMSTAIWLATAPPNRPPTPSATGTIRVGIASRLSSFADRFGIEPLVSDLSNSNFHSGKWSEHFPFSISHLSFVLAETLLRQ